MPTTPFKIVLGGSPAPVLTSQANDAERQSQVDRIIARAERLEAGASRLLEQIHLTRSHADPKIQQQGQSPPTITP